MRRFMIVALALLIAGCANAPLPQLSLRIDVPAIGSAAVVIGHPDMDHDHEDDDDAETAR